MSTNKLSPIEILRNVSQSLELSTSIDCELKRVSEYIKLISQSCQNPDGSFVPDPLMNVIKELKDLNYWLVDILSNRVSNLDKTSTSDEKEI